MSEYIHLIGAEDVQRAGQNMQRAANTIQQAVFSLEDSLHRHRLFMDDWLQRAEAIFTDNQEE